MQNSSQNNFSSHRNYRYSYNGMEKDDEVSGNGNSYTTQFRQYDPRLGRWKSLDPLAGKFANMSPFNAFNNNPIFYTDPLGLEGEKGSKKNKSKKDKGNSKTEDGESESSSTESGNMDDVAINTDDTKIWNDGYGYTIITPQITEHQRNPGDRLIRKRDKMNDAFSITNKSRRYRVAPRRTEAYKDFLTSNRYKNWLSKTQRDGFYALSDGKSEGLDFGGFGNFTDLGPTWIASEATEFNHWGFHVAIIKPDGTIGFESIGFITGVGSSLYWKAGNSFGQPAGTVMRFGPNNEIYDNTSADPNTILMTSPQDLNTFTEYPNDQLHPQFNLKIA